MKKVVKRDGVTVEFDAQRIYRAIEKAFIATKTPYKANDIASMTKSIVDKISEQKNSCVSVESIQDLVEQTLIAASYIEVAHTYIRYRDKRSAIREKSSSLMLLLNDLTFKEASTMDLKRENANIDSNTAMGTMLKYGSECSKWFNCSTILSEVSSKAHKRGDIHIHDLDFYSLTTTCCQIDLEKLFEGGFSTGHGFVREPNGIIAASSLACIAIQANQNDQHGGQSVPAIDYYLAPYVTKTYIMKLKDGIDYKWGVSGYDLKQALLSYLEEHKSIMNKKGYAYIKHSIRNLIKSQYDEHEVDVLWIPSTRKR